MTTPSYVLGHSERELERLDREHETSQGNEAYAPFERPTAGPYREGTLPDSG